MDTLFCEVFPSIQRDTDIERLLEAVRNRTYPTFYTLLKRRNECFGALEALELCAAAVRSKLTLRAFETLLEHCPPLEKFLWAGSYSAETMDYGRMVFGTHGLVECAAAWDRADILDLLLRRGGNLNRGIDYEISPLEAAIDGHALRSVERLMQEPDLDVTLTPRLLNSWSYLDNGMALLDFCLQTAAPRLIGKTPGLHEPNPVPSQLTVVHAARAGNWKLFMRLLEERGTPEPKLAREALRFFKCGMLESEMSELFGELEDQEGERNRGRERARALDGLLTRCPFLLRGRRACRMLVSMYLFRHEESADILAPWLERIRQRRVLVHSLATRESSLSIVWMDKLLALWERYLPDGPVPQLSRRMSMAWIGNRCLEDPEEIRRVLEKMLAFCELSSQKLPEGRISGLASCLLQYGTPQMLEEQFGPGGLLEEEDADVLLKFAAGADIPNINRALVASCMRKEEEYAL